MCEVMSDVFGALAAEKFLKEKPLKEKEEKATSNSFLGAICKDYNGETTEDTIQVAPFYIDKIIWEKLRLSHPSHEDRVNKILLNLPGMEEAFGCKRKIPACFDHLSLVQRGSANSQEQGGRK